MRWEGFSVEDDTFEPESNFVDIDLLNQYQHAQDLPKDHVNGKTEPLDNENEEDISYLKESEDGRYEDDSDDDSLTDPFLSRGTEGSLNRRNRVVTTC